MRSIDIQERIEMANIFCPYIGTYSSAGNDGKNRISFIKPIKKIFLERERIFDLKKMSMICTKEKTDLVEYFSLRDYLTEDFLNENRSYNIFFSRGISRLVFPKEITINSGELVWQGKGNKIIIYQKEDLERFSC